MHLTRATLARSAPAAMAAMRCKLLHERMRRVIVEHDAFGRVVLALAKLDTTIGEGRVDAIADVVDIGRSGALEARAHRDTSFSAARPASGTKIRVFPRRGSVRPTS